MGRIGIDSLQAGMVLSNDACTFRGQLLLRAGTTLTAKHIETMQAWGVAEVETEGCSEATLEEIEDQIRSHAGLAALNAEIDERFSGLRDDPVMREILRITKKQLLERTA